MDAQIRIDELIRCRRKSIGLIIDRSANLIVRAPYWVTIDQINKLLIAKSRWILHKQEHVKKKQQIPKILFTEEEKAVYKAQALKQIKQRVEHYAKFENLNYSSIRIGEARTRWGSCSSRGSLVFNWKLILMPARVLDYLVVHELMHLKQQNHSRRYWQEVEAIIPDYKDDERWLKEHGHQWH